MKHEQSSVFNFTEGEILLLNKPETWTSFNVVAKVRGLIRYHTDIKKRLKVGHAGTLDPLATGLLIVCTGKLTKQIDKIQQTDKEYTGSIRLGATTPTFDRETEPDEVFPVEHITQEDIRKAAKTFEGEIQQIPPRYSAIKIKGERAYNIARENREVELKARKVQIHSFEITGIELPDVHFRISCSKGTYIRSLAHDFGKVLQSGAYLTALKRTRIGPYSLDDALEIQHFEEIIRQLFHNT